MRCAPNIRLMQRGKYCILVWFTRIVSYLFILVYTTLCLRICIVLFAAAVADTQMSAAQGWSGKFEMLLNFVFFPIFSPRVST